MKNELLSKSTEAEAFKSRNMELEECQLRQEDAINAMKRQTKKICVSYKKNKSYSMMTFGVNSYCPLRLDTFEQWYFVTKVLSSDLL